MAVVDASVAFEFLAEGPDADVAAERLGRPGEPLWAPHLIDAEVGHALRRTVLLDELSAASGEEALWDLEELPLRRVDHELLVQAAWDLRDRVSFYDGLYVALAGILEEPLITFDARLARSGVDARVEVLSAAS